jgi:nucleoid DNA-binding protein
MSKKSNLIEKVARDTNLPLDSVERAISLILSGVAEGLRKDGQISLGDFGGFKLFTKLVSTLENPSLSTNKTIIQFVPNTKLRNVINKTE